LDGRDGRIRQQSPSMENMMFANDEGLDDEGYD